MKAKLLIPFAGVKNNYDAGTEFTLSYSRDTISTHVIAEHADGRKIKISFQNAHKYFAKFKKPPGLKALENQMENARCTTVTGQRGIEADGCGPDGFPAWPMAMGFV